jgi:hypothetical protein
MGSFLGEPKMDDWRLKELNLSLYIDSKHVYTYLGDGNEVLHSYR